uniref:DUF6816 domain-containing protein n=1 Tax=Phaeomonas parva TaxID=124430 RepID=A0A7S1XNX4_9STRA
MRQALLRLLIGFGAGAAAGLEAPWGLSRRDAIARSVMPGSLLFGAVPALAADRPEERSTYSKVSKAAANLPGYGPPDVWFPEQFLGSWTMKRTVVSFDTANGPLNEKAALVEEQLLRSLPAGPEVQYPVRFQRLGNNVIADREFNERSYFEALAAATKTAAPSASSWDPTSPNVLTLTLGSGAVIEKKVLQLNYDPLPRPCPCHAR